MEEITKETLEWAYKPYDIVTNKDKCVGIIQEVSVNDSQIDRIHQITYAVNWIIGDEYVHAWWNHNDLEKHANVFVEIAKMSCHPLGENEEDVNTLFNNFGIHPKGQ